MRIIGAEVLYPFQDEADSVPSLASIRDLDEERFIWTILILILILILIF